MATGVKLTSPSGVAAGAPETAGVDVTGKAVAVESPVPEDSPEELHPAASNNTNTAVSNAGALNTCQIGPVRKSVVDGKLLC